MSKEAEITFERKNDKEQAILVHLGEDLGGLDIPKVRKYIERIGLNLSTFKNLLTLNFEPIEQFSEEIPGTSGEKIEDMVFRLAQTEIGLVEVSDVDLYPTVISPSGKPDISLHLKSGPKGGFEAIYVLDGEAQLLFPNKVDPVAPGVYAASIEGERLVLTKGDLVIIPAPTANGWCEVEEGFRYRYICHPRWSSTIVKKVY